VSGLLGISRVIDFLNVRIGKITAWAIVIAILVSAVNAIIRKVFGTSSNAWLELQWYLSGPFFWRSYNSGEVSTNAGGLLIWPAKGLILLGFILLFFQWLSELIKRIAIMRGKLEDEHAAGGHHAAAEAEAERLLAELTDKNKTGEPPGDGVR
jgi:TRAP-type mannitol/chloroaromatic compound transport system permease small subunit